VVRIQRFTARIILVTFAVFSIAALINWDSEAQDSHSQLSRQEAAGAQIRLSVSVTDEQGRVAPKLSKDHFTILDGKEPQEIRFFEERDEPYSIVFLFDTSGSMLKTHRELSNILGSNILRFITQTKESTEYSFMTFGERPQILMDWTHNSSVVGEALNKLALVRPSGLSALYDACYLGIETLRQRSNPRRAIVLLSDGHDNVSKRSYQRLGELLKQSDVVVYALYTTDPINDQLGEFGRSVLRELTTVSGGTVFETFNKSKINELFDSLAMEMRHQYVIGFSPAGLDGKWRTVKIKVKPIEVPNTSQPNKPNKQMKLTARTRHGFYAPNSSR
jgi:Ca-activated chloride channel family protein